MDKINEKEKKALKKEIIIVGIVVLLIVSGLVYIALSAISTPEGREVEENEGSNINLNMPSGNSGVYSESNKFKSSIGLT